MALNNPTAPSASGSAPDDELLQQLAQEIDFARLTPGQTYMINALARRLRATPKRMQAALSHFVELGLLSIDGDSCTIAPVIRDTLVPRLDRRLALEQEVAAAAANNAAALDVAEINDAAMMLKRCALVGDIDGYMMADRRLERAVAAAAGLPELSEEIVALKREFRRAWCAYNRLRDLNVPAAFRQTLMQAVLNGDAEAARVAVQQFIHYLRTSY